MNHDDEYKASEPHDAEILTHLLTKRDILERLGKRRLSGQVRAAGLRLIRAAARQRVRREPRLRRCDRHPYWFDGRADRPAIDRHRSYPANCPRYSPVDPTIRVTTNRTARTDPIRPRTTRHTTAIEGPRSVGPSPRSRDRVTDQVVDLQADPRRRDAAEHREAPTRRAVRRQAREATPRERRRRRDR